MTDSKPDEPTERWATVTVSGGRDQQHIHIAVAKGYVAKRILEWDEGEIRITLEPVAAERGIQ